MAMNDGELFEQLEKILYELSIEIKYGRGYFDGGICRYKGNQILYLNRAKNRDEHIELILSELKVLNLDKTLKNKKIRELLSQTE